MVVAHWTDLWSCIGLILVTGLTNVVSYELNEWSAESGIDCENIEEHKTYVDKVCATFEEKMKESILEASKRASNLRSDTVYVEV